MAVCQPDTCALLSEVAAMGEKLAAMTQTQSTLERNLGAMMQKTATVEASLQTCKSQIEELRKINQAQDEQLKALVGVKSASASRMAFTAALGTSAGPFEHDTPLQYQRILSNIGSGYNPATGIFTAMVRGMYYFSYTMYNNNSGQPNSVVSLMMNSQKMVSTWDTVGDVGHDSATNAAVVQLEAGDSVFVKIYANRVLYDDGNYYNTFSGFLLFTL
ncbi:complement C1q-like protein 2 [Sebastes fasciatus]|uniref:complement C1q-like protein 2 n=1 Tax=Sebastes fasciatus TaxID=394691 RepID=UPI003D9ECF47